MMDLIYPISSDLVSTAIVCPYSFKRVLLEVCDLTLNEARILLCLSSEDSDLKDTRQLGHSTASLAQDLHLKPNSVSSSVAILERKGLVERVESELDRRKLVIMLTEGGKEKIDQIDEALAKTLTDQWMGLDISIQDVNCIGAEMFDIGRGKKTRTYDDEKNYDSSYFENNLEISALFRQACAGYGLNGNEFRILFELYQHSEGIRSGSLSSKLLLRLSELSQVCNRLAQRNLISRSRYTDDKRSVLVKLTDKGIKLIEQAAPAIDKGFMTGFGYYVVPEEARKAYLVAAEHIIEQQRRQFNLYA